MSVGDRIRELRAKRGMTHAELAAAVDVSEGQVSKWERGVDLPRLPNLRALSRALKASCDYIVGCGPEVEKEE